MKSVRVAPRQAAARCRARAPSMTARRAAAVKFSVGQSSRAPSAEYFCW